MSKPEELAVPPLHCYCWQNGMSPGVHYPECIERRERLSLASQPCPAWEDWQHCWEVTERIVGGWRDGTWDSGVTSAVKRCICGAELHLVKP